MLNEIEHAGAVLAGTIKKEAALATSFLYLVPTEGLEPPHLAAHGPEPCASTNSATWAKRRRDYIGIDLQVNVRKSMFIALLMHFERRVAVSVTLAMFLIL